MGFADAATGQAHFATMQKYMPRGLNMKKLGEYMNSTFAGRLDEAKIKPIRERWKGKLVIKGVATEEDMDASLKLGLDGVIISNHGGRQIDAGESTIHSLSSLVSKYRGKTRLMIDSGLRSGPDIARALASGADFTFLGRTFMYSVAALGQAGGQHAMAMAESAATPGDGTGLLPYD